MGEPVLTTRWGDLVKEPIEFLGHELHYSMTFTDPPDRWRRREGDRAINSEMVISDADEAALSISVVNGARKEQAPDATQRRPRVVIEDALGPDTPLIASVALELFRRTFLSGGGGG